MSTNPGIYTTANGRVLTRRQMLNRMCAGFGMLGLAGLVVGPVVLSLAREMGEQRLRAA